MSQIVKGVEWTPFSFYSRSVLRITAEDGANFTCQAMNQLSRRVMRLIIMMMMMMMRVIMMMMMMSREAAVEQRSFMVFVDRGGEEPGAGAGPVRGYCAPYNGAVCRNYIVGRGLVWFNIR